MKNQQRYIEQIREKLNRVSTLEKAESSRRYFPQGISCVGATASDIKLIVRNFHTEHSELTATEVLSITECLLKNAKFNEESLTAFGLINRFVKNNFDDDLLLRFEYWLENYANNWSLVDDLCIKTIYQFLLSRPHLIEKTQRWAHSEISWARRASNVVWVKFVKRKIGKSIYYLDKELVFKNCDLLLSDNDVYVQKSIGWLLKVTSIQHESDVIDYIRRNSKMMPPSTIRYALEKVSVSSRTDLLTKG